MKEETLMELDKISINSTTWDGDDWPSTLEFEWTEPSNYCLYPDDEYSFDVSKEQAVELIEVLTKHFKL
jgi:hypothetical protein